MKYIFDFDDVLFNDTLQFKEQMYFSLEKAGIPRDVAKEYYKEIREKGFSLKNFISTLFTRHKIDKVSEEKLHDEIMNESRNFANTELVELIKKLGKNNCYILTFGDEGHQLDKINAVNVASLFAEIVTVKESKKESVEKICAKHKEEQIIFVDDKEKHLLDLDFKKCPNLKTILYTGQSVNQEIKKLAQSELDL
jgi:FMN phosphatase YigB (HAD superfamily)